MKTAVKIMAGLGALIMVGLAFIAISMEEKLTAERNAQRTYPARMAKLDKLKQQPADETAQPEQPEDEKLS